MTRRDHDGPAQAALQPGDMDVRWNEGSPDCKAHPQTPLQVHRYNAQTFILREGLCATFEAPFMYLLVGSTRALMIDTGDVADPKVMPLARTVKLSPVPEVADSVSVIPYRKVGSRSLIVVLVANSSTVAPKLE